MVKLHGSQKLLVSHLLRNRVFSILTQHVKMFDTALMYCLKGDENVEICPNLQLWCQQLLTVGTKTYYKTFIDYFAARGKILYK